METQTRQVTIRVPREMVLPDNTQWENRFEVRSESSNRVYTIAQHKTGRYWGCSCPGWKAHRNCKHLAAVGVPNYQRPYEARIQGV